MNNEITERKISALDAISYLCEGIKMALSKECRLYVMIPIIVNFVILFSLGYATFNYISNIVSNIFKEFPEFLIFLAYIITAILGLLIGFVSCYIFSTVATIIASPFYGLLADKVEMKLNGTQSDNMSFFDIIKDIPRILKREARKQLFFLPLAFLGLIIYFVPVVNILSPVYWFLLTAWMGTLQYTDYAYDNHKISFADMQRDLKSNKLSTFTMGAFIAFLLCIPVLNLIIPPAAVCAGTKYYLSLQKTTKLEFSRG